MSRRKSTQSTTTGEFRPDGRSLSSLWLGWLLLGLLLICQAGQGAAQAAPPVGRLIPLKSPLADETLGQVRRNALELQEVAAREDRQAFLVLEISPGISEFHHCYALADFLTKEPLPRVTTVAWIPESVSGNAVLVALACQEIVLAPEAALGDMGSGRALPADQQAIVRSILARRRNPLVTEALATAMMDPDVTLLQLTVDSGDNMKETRLATETDAKALRDQGVVIADSKLLKEPGTPARFTGAQARARSILTARMSDSRKQLVEAYQIEIDALRELGPAEPVGRVVYIELHDIIDEVFSAFAQRQIERAVTSGAKTIIFEIDSPGGLLYVCQDLAPLMANLKDRGVHTVAWIPRKAFSGGAILAVACDDIYMHPDATIGDAIPINLMGNIIVHAPEKILSVEVELLRSLAGKKERPAALLEKMADVKLQVFEVTHAATGRKWYMSQQELLQSGEGWVKGPEVPEARDTVALTVSGRRAHELMLAESPVLDQTELKARLGIPADQPLRAAARTWIDSLVFVLNHPAVAGLMFFVAVICIYLEMATMTGFFGIIAALSFAMFFWSKVMGGTAGGLEVALFMVGLGCLAMELFVVPGFGIFGVSGILLVLGSLVMASQTISGMGLEYDLRHAIGSVVSLASALIAVVVSSVIISMNLHRIPLLNTLIVTPPGYHGELDGQPRLRPDHAGPHAALLGQTGTAATVLRPAGKAKIDGHLYDVVSDGPFIEQNAPIQVTQVTRSRIVVRAV